MVLLSGVEPPTDYESDLCRSRILLIKHLRRLPISKAAYPRHKYGTPNFDWTQRLLTSPEFRLCANQV